MRDKNPKQWINIKFCLKIDTSTGEMLAAPLDHVVCI
jgi:hypothetical protein